MLGDVTLGTASRPMRGSGQRHIPHHARGQEVGMKLAIHESSGRPGHTDRTWAASVYQVVVAELARLSGALRPQGCK